MGISERAIPPPPSLRSVLTAWRAAERALTEAAPSSDGWQHASHDFEVLQAEYHGLANHDLDDHGAPARSEAPGRGSS